MRYEVGHVQRIGKYSGKERRLYYVRDRVTQRLVLIDEGYANLYTSRKRIAEDRADELEAGNKECGPHGSELIRRG
jgi:hypothetical protein